MRALLERQLSVVTADLAGSVRAPGHPIEDVSVLINDRLEVFTGKKNVPGDHVAFTLEVIELIGREAHCFGAEGRRPRRGILVCSAERVQSLPHFEIASIATGQ